MFQTNGLTAMLHPRSPLISAIRAFSHLQPSPQITIHFALGALDLAFGLEHIYGDLDELVADLGRGHRCCDLVFERVDGSVLLRVSVSVPLLG